MPPVDASHMSSAIAACAAAFDTSRHWSSHARRELCQSVLAGVTSLAEPFACQIAVEAKKPIRTARAEVARALTTFRLAVEESTRIAGEVLPVDIDARSVGYRATVHRVPIGPCAFITPFNFPLNLVAHKVAPALATGCPFIVKPSERTPATAHMLGDVVTSSLRALHMPETFCQVLEADRTVARQLVEDDRIKLLSFTGSPQVGWPMKAAAGRKAVVLELGNNSAVIVEPDTDLSDAVPRIVAGAFAYAGQSCISVQRIFLHEDLAPRAIELLVGATRTLVVGNVLDETTDVGPMIDQAAAQRIESWVTAALAAGAQLLIGGQRQGDVYLPTLLRNVPPTAQLACNEAFGPVAIIDTYRDFPDVLQRVNNSPFGLQAGLFSHDTRKIHLAFTTLDVAGLIINDVPTTRIDNMPYGGLKDSGLGREGVKYAIEHMTELKVLLTRVPCF